MVGSLYPWVDTLPHHLVVNGSFLERARSGTLLGLIQCNVCNYFDRLLPLPIFFSSVQYRLASVLLGGSGHGCYYLFDVSFSELTCETDCSSRLVVRCRLHLTPVFVYGYQVPQMGAQRYLLCISGLDHGLLCAFISVTQAVVLFRGYGPVQLGVLP
jgi:hypothetical protein